MIVMIGDDDGDDDDSDDDDLEPPSTQSPSPTNGSKMQVAFPTDFKNITPIVGMHVEEVVESCRYISDGDSDDQYDGDEYDGDEYDDDDHDDIDHDDDSDDNHDDDGSDDGDNSMVMMSSSVHHLTYLPTYLPTQQQSSPMPFDHTISPLHHAM